jgi:hypothetical protein
VAHCSNVIVALPNTRLLQFAKISSNLANAGSCAAICAAVGLSIIIAGSFGVPGEPVGGVVVVVAGGGVVGVVVCGAACVDGGVVGAASAAINSNESNICPITDGSGVYYYPVL